ncbi:hypothetical protein CEY16_09450 [Halalkalibacillus sediminis]|uniref:Uncharacterized protein n=1 Tax=Halalkalibacillus sediminis TaxID=2018042 RepID=A0A2I0QV01_9BACI|nr:TraR/DksA family transcriptional regulator [Halalkalibacillus sediminis]PKR78129.1 hypothetical protein CEY16_09450 [Halalkalibacillus sediminis]
MNQQDLNIVKKQLLEEREHLQEQIHSYTEGGSSLEDSVGELTASDQHYGDLGTEQFEREKDLTLFNKQQKELEEVNHALEKIEKGEYGYDEETGEEIPTERLKAMPTARYKIKE